MKRYECSDCTGCVNLSITTQKDTIVLMLENKTGKVYLNFENLAKLIGLYKIMKTLNDDIDHVFVKGLRLLRRKKDNEIIYTVFRKPEKKRTSFSIQLTDKDFETIISEFPKFFNEFKPKKKNNVKIYSYNI